MQGGKNEIQVEALVKHRKISKASCRPSNAYVLRFQIR
jgi:hypothetical protein